MQNVTSQAFRLFFTFDGRIGRAQYWTGLVAIIAIDAIMTRIIEGEFSPDNVRHPMLYALQAVLLFGPALAIALKRFSDIGWPTWIVYPLLVAQTIIAAAVSFHVFPAESLNEMCLAFFGLGLLLAEIVPCGFLRAAEAAERQEAMA